MRKQAGVPTPKLNGSHIDIGITNALRTTPMVSILAILSIDSAKDFAELIYGYMSAIKMYSIGIWKAYGHSNILAQLDTNTTKLNLGFKC